MRSRIKLLRCVAEHNWLKCTANSDKSKFKSTYIASRKSFDREVQRSKRLYWFNFQRDLMNECNSDNASFWKTIGKVGVGHMQKRLLLWKLFLMMAAFHIKLPLLYMINGDATSPLFLTVKAIVTFSLQANPFLALQINPIRN